MNNIYKLAAIGSLLSLTNCQSEKQLDDKSALVTGTYILQTCDKEERAFFIELKQNDETFTAFISTQNKHKIPSAQKKYRVGQHVSGALIKTTFDGVYQVRE